MIDPKKKYKTRDGREVRIYATDANGVAPVHGAIRNGGEWNIAKWSPGGLISGSSDHSDLIEQPEEFDLGVMVVNVYKDAYHQAHRSRAEADRDASPDRIACLEIPIKGVVGQGLTK